MLLITKGGESIPSKDGPLHFDVVCTASSFDGAIFI